MEECPGTIVYVYEYDRMLVSALLCRGLWFELYMYVYTCMAFFVMLHTYLEKELEDEEDDVDNQGQLYIKNLAKKVRRIMPNHEYTTPTLPLPPYPLFSLPNPMRHLSLLCTCTRIRTRTCTRTRTHTHPSQLGGETDSESDDDSDLAQTLFEIDYETVVDDEDVVDEFLVFKTTLQCKHFC